MERNRPNKKRLSWQGVAYVLLVVMAVCLVTVVGAASPAGSGRPDATAQPTALRARARCRPQEGDQGPESLHIVVGHSLLIHTPSQDQAHSHRQSHGGRIGMTSPAGSGDHRQADRWQQSDAVG